MRRCAASLVASLNPSHSDFCLDGDRLCPLRAALRSPPERADEQIGFPDSPQKGPRYERSSREKRFFTKIFLLPKARLRVRARRFYPPISCAFAFKCSRIVCLAMKEIAVAQPLLACVMFLCIRSLCETFVVLRMRRSVCVVCLRRELCLGRKRFLKRDAVF